MKKIEFEQESPETGFVKTPHVQDVFVKFQSELLNLQETGELPFHGEESELRLLDLAGKRLQKFELRTDHSVADQGEPYMTNQTINKEQKVTAMYSRKITRTSRFMKNGKKIYSQKEDMTLHQTICGIDSEETGNELKVHDHRLTRVNEAANDFKKKYVHMAGKICLILSIFCAIACAFAAESFHPYVLMGGFLFGFFPIAMIAGLIYLLMIIISVFTDTAKAMKDSKTSAKAGAALAKSMQNTGFIFNAEFLKDRAVFETAKIMLEDCPGKIVEASLCEEFSNILEARYGGTCELLSGQKTESGTEAELVILFNTLIYTGKKVKEKVKKLQIRMYHEDQADPLEWKILSISKVHKNKDDN